MAATKARALAILLPASFVLVLAFQNCAVELSEETYGAKGKCEPTAEELTAFQPALTALQQPTNQAFPAGGTPCTTCHTLESGNPAANVFRITLGSDAAVAKTNYCSSIVVSEKFASPFLTTTSHLGGAYNANDVQAITAWAQGL